MTNEPSPRPWRMESDNLTLRPPVCFILGANGAKITGGFFSPSDAALIVDAVNERDRLRDLVRRIEAEMERCHRRDGGISQELMDAVYEASAAIGEGAK